MSGVILHVEDTMLPTLTEVLDGLLALVKAGDVPLELCERLIRVVERRPESLFLQAEIRPTGSAGDAAVFLEPSDGLLRLRAAVRARDFDLHLIEEALCHLETSHPQSADDVTETPAGPAGAAE